MREAFAAVLTFRHAHDFFPRRAFRRLRPDCGPLAGRLLLVRGLPVDPLAPLLPLRSRWRLAPGNLEQPAHRALKVRGRLRAFDVFGFAFHGSITLSAQAHGEGSFIPNSRSASR